MERHLYMYLHMHAFLCMCAEVQIFGIERVAELLFRDFFENAPETQDLFPPEVRAKYRDWSCDKGSDDGSLWESPALRTAEQRGQRTTLQHVQHRLPHTLWSTGRLGQKCSEMLSIVAAGRFVHSHCLYLPPFVEVCQIERGMRGKRATQSEKASDDG